MWIVPSGPISTSLTMRFSWDAARMPRLTLRNLKSTGFAGIDPIHDVSTKKIRKTIFASQQQKSKFAIRRASFSGDFFWRIFCFRTARPPIRKCSTQYSTQALALCVFTGVFHGFSKRPLSGQATVCEVVLREDCELGLAKRFSVSHPVRLCFPALYCPAQVDLVASDSNIPPSGNRELPPKTSGLPFRASAASISCGGNEGFSTPRSL